MFESFYQDGYKDGWNHKPCKSANDDYVDGWYDGKSDWVTASIRYKEKMPGNET